MDRFQASITKHFDPIRVLISGSKIDTYVEYKGGDIYLYQMGKDMTGKNVGTV